VLRLLPTELSNREIGEELFVSVNTVKTHLRNIYAKLRARSREQAWAAHGRSGCSDRVTPRRPGRQSAMDDMACRELVEVVTDYLEGALGAVDRARFEAHLADCGGCRDYLDQMRRTIQAVGRIDAERLPAELRDGLLASFRDWRAA